MEETQKQDVWRDFSERDCAGELDRWYKDSDFVDRKVRCRTEWSQISGQHADFSENFPNDRTFRPPSLTQVVEFSDFFKP